jgi:leader peptidase (prepilin peptidase)/N-methyltransferase
MNFYLNTFENVTNIPELFAYIFIFIIGTAIGSFLNVVIHRVPNGESIVFPNSACPNCKKLIKPYDNIPILSWLILGGKCRNCQNPISPRYLFVELLTGFLFLLVYWSVGFNAFLPVVLVFVAAIVSLVFIDAEHMILPNVITYPLLVFALFVRLVFPLLFGADYFSDLKVFPLNQMRNSPVWLVSVVSAVSGAIVGGGFLWLVGAIWKKLRGVDAMGLGDVKMMFAVGALLGWRLTLLSIFIGSFAGAVIGVVVISPQKEKDFQMQIPFGIFLGIGSILSLLYGEQIIHWYTNNFLP